MHFKLMPAHTCPCILAHAGVGDLGVSSREALVVLTALVALSMLSVLVVLAVFCGDAFSVLTVPVPLPALVSITGPITAFGRIFSRIIS